MSLTIEATGTVEAAAEFRVKDLSLASWGRREIRLAEQEMPGLLALRAEHGPAKPLRGQRITGSLHMTIQTAVLIETLAELGAQVRWVSCNVFSTQDHAAAAVAVGPGGTPEEPHGIPVFAHKGESHDEYWDFTARALDFGNGLGPTQLVDDGGDVTLLIHEGWRLEESGVTPDPATADSAAQASALALLERIRAEDPGRWHRLVPAIRGVSEETTCGINRLRRLQSDGQLLFPAIDVNDSVTKSKFDNTYGCRHSVVDGLNRATDVMLAGKLAVVCGYGEVGKGCAQALRGQGARVVVTEVDPICALQAAMEGFEVRPVEDVVGRADLFITATGNRDILTVEHMAAMKDKAILANIGHFDTEIDMPGLERLRKEGRVVRENVKPQYDEWRFLDGHSVLVLAEGCLMNLGCATGHPSFVMSMSFSNQVLAQLELAANGHAYGKKLHVLPKELDEKVARLHLEKLDVRLTALTPRQAAYIGVRPEGPYKPESYRY